MKICFVEKLVPVRESFSKVAGFMRRITNGITIPKVSLRKAAVRTVPENPRVSPLPIPPAQVRAANPIHPLEVLPAHPLPKRASLNAAALLRQRVLPIVQRFEQAIVQSQVGEEDGCSINIF